ncbi:MAG: type III pantothenate kinase [Panacagrimonas sp.]
MLLLDVGNTRLKWARVGHGGTLDIGGAVVHAGAPAEAIDALDVEGPEPVEAVWIASVAGPDNDQRLAQAVARRWACVPQFAVSEAACAGLRNGYAEPRRLGVDRWLALLAAWSETGGACVVADAGTALTVDVVDAQGQHRGGVIAAGLRTSENAVLGATRFPTREAPLPPHAGLGLDTESCVRQGAMLSVLGAIDRAACEVCPGARRYLCGGDAPTLLPLLGAGWEHRPALVLEGLRVLAQSGKSGRNRIE